MTRLDRAAMVATVAAVLSLPWSLPAAAQTVLETVTTCGTGTCTPSERIPPEGTVMRCLVVEQIPETAYLVKCLDILLGMVAADPRINGYTGPLVCTRMMEVSCPAVVQATVKDHPEPLSSAEKLDCTIHGHYRTYDLVLECAQ